MITIILGVIVIWYVLKKFDMYYDEGVIAGGIIVGAILIVCGILAPMAGFTAPVETSVELMPLRLEQATDKEYYIQESNSYYYYAYDNSEEYGLNGGAYQEANLLKESKVKVYESEECTTPILKSYKSKSRISWYSLAGMWSDEEYVFYIPVGTKYIPE